MRFTEFLRTAVLSFGAAATTLAVATVAAANTTDQLTLLVLAAGWWTVAACVGFYLGRKREVSTGVGRLMANARSRSSTPEPEPVKLLLGRLWALVLFVVIAAGLSFLSPQIPAIAAGYALIPALAWRKQEAAVTAVEDRDGVCFYLEKTSPLRPTKLSRTPSFRRFDHIRAATREHDLAR